MARMQSPGLSNMTRPAIFGAVSSRGGTNTFGGTNGFGIGDTNGIGRAGGSNVFGGGGGSNVFGGGGTNGFGGGGGSNGFGGGGFAGGTIQPGSVGTATSGTRRVRFVNQPTIRSYFLSPAERAEKAEHFRAIRRRTRR